ncbi:MAG: helix-turn-helix domain-containing protein [Motiliproteus sp.]
MNITGNSTAAQCLRLQAALQEVGAIGITTIEAREKHDIMQPAARIWELRHNHGLNIATVRTQAINAQGHKHSNARYVLLPGEWNDDNDKS